MKRFIPVAVFVLLLNCGCVPGLFSKKGGFGKVDSVDFNQLAQQHFAADYASTLIAVAPSKLPTVIQLRLKVPDNLEILALRLTARKNLNISRFLLTGKKNSDYLFSQKTHELFINFRLPLIYFLDGHLRYRLTIFAFDPNNPRTLKPEEKNILFYWKPRIATRPSGFSYVDGLAALPVDRLETYVPLMRKEFSSTKTSRLDPSYRARIETLLTR